MQNRKERLPVDFPGNGVGEKRQEKLPFDRDTTEQCATNGIITRMCVYWSGRNVQAKPILIQPRCVHDWHGVQNIGSSWLVGCGPT